MKRTPPNSAPKAQESRERAASVWSRLRPAVVLVGALALGAIFVSRQADLRQEDARETARLVANSKITAIEGRVSSALDVARSLETLVRTAGGVPPDFATLAAPLLPGVSSLQLQPGGVVRAVAPFAGNEGLIGRSFLDDSGTGETLAELAERGEAAVFAPVPLPDDEPGLRVHLPVSLPAGGGEEAFWGFTAVALPLDEVLGPVALQELEEMGYRYALHAGGPSAIPLAGLELRELEDPVAGPVALPSGSWVLALEPSSGWDRPLPVVRDAVLAVLFSLVLVLLVAGMEGLRTARVRADGAAREAAGQRDLLRTVLGSMAEGVAAFDRDLKLSVYNERWATIRDYPKRMITPGRPLEDFVRYDVKRGVHGSEVREEVLQQELERIRRGEEREGPLVLPDGQVLEIRGESLPGGGLVHTVTDVTEQYRARERFRVLFESSPDGYFLVQDGDVVDCNGAALSLMGGGPKEAVVGSLLAEYLGGEFGAAAVRDLLRRGDRDGEVREDWTLPRRDADPIPFEVTVRRVDLTPAEDALLVVLHDLRERKEMERALRESQQFLKGVVDHSSALISAKDLEGRYILVNPQWQRVMGISRREALGRTDHELFAETVAVNREVADREALEQGEPVTTEESAWVGDRVRSFLTVAFPILGPDAEPEAVCRVSTDVTPLKEVQEELQVARDRAEAADRAKGDFLANMSHEIRTPMNAIIGLAHLVLRTDLDPRQRDQLRKLEAASRSLLGILNDILDFSKIEAGKLDMETVPFHLEEVLRNVVDLFGARAQEKGLEFLVRVDPRTPVELVGDPLRLGQVLTNLVSNAAKFTDEGEIVVRVAPVRVVDDQTTLRFAVRDTGIGMSPEQAAGLFRAFSQGDTSTTRRYGGTGLGLAICRRLVELMGGQIEVESLEGEGSTFHFTAMFGRASARLAGGGRVAELKGRRAVVADDNESARIVLEEMLGGFGIGVVTVPTGEAALQAVREADERGEPFDFAILDWRMPGMDGFDVAERIREGRGSAAPPATILVTAHGRDEILERGGEEDPSVRAVVLKPVTSSVLVETLLAALDVELPDDDRGGREAGRPRRRAVDAFEGMKGVRVLLVEDNEVNREVALGLLGEAGARVETASHGGEALAILREDPFGFEAVLMDVHMPEVDGYAATRLIRGDPDLAWLPVIAMTAGALEEDRTRCLEAGMDEHVAKPVDLDDLFGKLTRWIEEGRGRRPVAPEPRSEAAEAPPGGEEEVAAAGGNDEADPVAPGPDDEAADRPPLDTDGAEADPDALRAAGVNPLRGLRNAGGNERLFRRILRRFVDTQTGAADTIRWALERGEIEEAIRSAHTLKGLAGTVGADDLQRRARELEVALREDRIGVVRTRLASVEADLVQIEAAFLGPDSGARGTPVPDARSSGETTAGRPGPSVDHREPRVAPEPSPLEDAGTEVRGGAEELVRRLERFLENGDTRALRLVEDLELRFTDTPLHHEASQVVDTAREYDFEGALGALRALRESIATGEMKGG